MGSVLSRIHYRAKSKKDPKLWVYGNLLDIKGDKMILNSKTWGVSFEGVEIIPKTLGQWIGLLDKNKKKIYEDDVIKHRRYSEHRKLLKNTEILCIVRWNKGYDHSPAHKKLTPDLKKNPSLFNKEPKFTAYPVDYNLDGVREGIFSWSVFHDCEVVGNIIDNPKLKKP